MSPARRPFRNWGGTATCQPAAFLQPSSEGELIAMLGDAAAQGQTVKVVGAGHSWSDIACTDGHQINLDRLDRVVAVDLARRQVTVQAGIRLHRLIAALRRHGLTLPVVGSILEQSIAGAISTATHGSAPGLGNLACQVVALRIVRADGSVQLVDAETSPDLLDACRVSLGALGIITEVTLRCVPAFVLREVSTPMGLDEVATNLPQLLASAPYLKLWWLPHTSLVQVYRFWPLDPEVAPVPPAGLPASTRLARWVDEAVINRQLFAGLLRLADRAPHMIPRLNAVVRAAYFRPRERVGVSTDLLPVAMPPRHEECEYSVPIAAAGPVLRALRVLIDDSALRVNFPAELRFAAADSAWLSPMHGRATCCVGAYIAHGGDRARYFATFEELMQSLGGRPHWGKQFTATAEYLRGVYPAWDRFAALRRAWDPRGLFLNPYLRRLFS